MLFPEYDMTSSQPRYDSQMDDETHPRHNGLNSGAVTILVIAGVAIVSVITTMACIMINNRRQRRVQRPQRIHLTTSGLSAYSNTTIPSFPRTGSTSPIILPPQFDPKFDAPPSYEEVMRTTIPVPNSTLSSAAPSPRVSDSPEQTVVTIEAQEQPTPARIDVEMEIVERPSTSTALSTAQAHLP